MTPSYLSVIGRIVEISPLFQQCCNQMVSLITNNGPVNLVLSPDTYVANNIRLRPGMEICGFYDANRPIILIYPPQYQAVAVVPIRRDESVILAHFDSRLTAENNGLRLNLSPATQIVTTNGQTYSCSVRNQLLLVYYTNTTRSIPPQTTPRKIVVFC